MSSVDEHIERLIVRRLDSDLTAEEERELDRKLLRNPDARRLLDDYERIDASAAEALNAVVAGGSSRFDAVAFGTTAMPRQRRGYYRTWWLVPGAIAAALLAWITPYPVADPPSGGPTVAESRPLQPVSKAGNPGTGADTDFFRNVSTGPLPARIKRSTGREVFGVVDEDGNLYWIQVERVRTLKSPNSRSAGRLSSGVM